MRKSYLSWYNLYWKNVPLKVRFSYLSGIKIDLFLDSPDTNGAEVITG